MPPSHITREEKIEAIRKKCIEANPEIIELKFGCWVHFPKHEDSPITSLERHSDGSWEVSWGCFHPELSASHYKIIGRPIQLADVLVAMKDKGIGITNNGLWLKYHAKKDNPSGWFAYSVMKWDFRKPLEDQSDETLSFLYDLI